ncbi:MAG: ATP/GTP-binding protein [Ignisphaera sp.]|nr:ATP/GTP-binding protein [Ignisphaera sp.]
MGKAIVMFLGPAGSGKSTLVYAYSKWLSEEFGLRVYKVNLDTAAEYIPYQPDFDIRMYIDAHRIAKELGLGPNGALVKSMEMLSENVDIVTKAIDNADADFILIDTPGQMEVFIFRDVALKLSQSLGKYGREFVAVFVLDGEVVKRYEDYAFVAIMCVALQARLGVDVVPVINKIDVAEDLSLVGDVVSDVEGVVEKLRNKGTYGEMLANIVNTIWLYAKATRVPRVSAKNMLGLEELHRVIHELTCSCGDLT